MAIRLNCPGCDTALNVAETLVGKTIKCKTCGEMMPVTSPAKAAPAKAAVTRRAAAVVADEDDAPAPSNRRKWDDGDDEASAAKSSGGSKGLLIAGIAAGLLLLMGAGMAGAYFFFAPASDDGKAVAAAPSPEVTAPNRLADAGASPPSNTEEIKPEPKKAEAAKPTSTEKSPSETEEQKASGSPPKKEDKPKPVEPVKPKAETPPATPGSAGLTSDDYEKKLMSGEMDNITREQAKRSTVFVYCEDRFGGAGTGSGWFGIENNIVITNAHVLKMKAPNSPPPAKITLYLNSGERGQNPGVKQREIPHQRIKILAVDRTYDIAVLEIQGEKDLPVPFKVQPTAKLKETQGINIMGFPLGYKLSYSSSSKEQPLISIRKSSVSAVRYDDFGVLNKLQVQGGISPGNSGGPQVDAFGNVIAMTVAMMVDDNTIGLAVPTEAVQGLIAGRIDTVQVETAFVRDGMVHIPVSISTLDPLKRLKSVGMSFWIGDSSNSIRPPGETRTGMVPSDKDYKEVTLNYDSATKLATGTIVLPPLTPGQSYWIQPFYSNAIVSKYYLPGRAVTMKGPPVEMSPVNLQVNLRTGPVRPFTLVRSSAVDTFAEGEGVANEQRAKVVSTLKGTETVIAPDRNDTQSAAVLRLKYDDADFKIDVAFREMKLGPRELQQLKQSIKAVEAYAYVNRTGSIYRTRTNVLGVTDPVMRAVGSSMSTDVLGTLQECSIPMPNREVTPGEKWTASLNVALSMGFFDRLAAGPDGGGPPGRPGQPRQRPGGGTASGEPEVSRKDFLFTEEVNYTYQGTRVRGGRKEAVIKVDGKITPGAGKAKDSANGMTKGYAFVDVGTGIVIDAEIESEFELDTSIEGIKQRTYSLNKYTLTRGGNVK